jgi:hypothetical protein
LFNIGKKNISDTIKKINENITQKLKSLYFHSLRNIFPTKDIDRSIRTIPEKMKTENPLTKILFQEKKKRKKKKSSMTKTNNTLLATSSFLFTF